MFEILRKQVLSPDVKRIDIFAPKISQKIKPGQFVSICPYEGEDRIPLTVIDSDSRRGTISLIFQKKGRSTSKLGDVSINEPVFSVLGPLGTPAKIEKKGKVVCIATGVGTAQILPICKAYKEAGNKVIGIIGARNKKYLMLEPQMRLACNRLFITTDDGSYERRGLATDILAKIFDEQEIQLVYAIGANEMMKKVCLITKQKKIETLVQLNPVMVDCMGMCGSCRVKVGGKMILACIEGPEFNGHKVDFDDYKIRINAQGENGKCCNHKSRHSQKKNVSETLAKFLLDTTKN